LSALRNGELETRMHEQQPADSSWLASRALLYGEGLIETVRLVAGRPRWLAAHRQRLAASCAALDLPAPPSLLQLDIQLRQLAARQGDGIVRLSWLAGASQPTDDPAGRAVSASLELAWRPWSVPTPAHLVSLCFRPGELAAHKTLARWPYVLARRRARAMGAHDALLVDAEGYVLESCFACVVAQTRYGELVTPPLDGRILPGIGRCMLLARRRDIVERSLHHTEIQALWLVSAARGIHAVIALDQRSLERPAEFAKC
jgi:branched-subunit amino acid aminotransferase/4-amino-4-deoxychorismate lyase